MVVMLDQGVRATMLMLLPKSGKVLMRALSKKNVSSWKQEIDWEETPTRTRFLPPALHARVMKVGRRVADGHAVTCVC